jgi:arginine exporter protein ArgO
MDVMTFDNLPEIEKVEVLIEKIPIWAWVLMIGGLIFGIVMGYNAIENKRKSKQLATEKDKLDKQHQALNEQVRLYEEYYKISLKS